LTAGASSLAENPTMQQTKMTREQAQRQLNAVLECLRPPAETLMALVRMLEDDAAKTDQRAA
jgi:hypothetical protein